MDWNKHLTYAGPASRENAPASLWLTAAGLPADGQKLPTTLSHFFDNSVRRDGNTDLYFYPCADPSSVGEFVVDTDLPPIYQFKQNYPEQAIGLLGSALIGFIFVGGGFLTMRGIPGARVGALTKCLGAALCVLAVLTLGYILPYIVALPICIAVPYCAFRVFRPGGSRFVKIALGGICVLTGVLFLVLSIGVPINHLNVPTPAPEGESTPA